MDIERARFNMVEQQIRPWDVLDQDVLDLLFVVKREEFVAPASRALAFTDTEIPIVTASGPSGEVMLAPRVEARLLQALALKKHEHVLEIGTGSGYMAALLGHRARHVVSREIHPALAGFARANLERAGIRNVVVEQVDGSTIDGTTLYDAIVFSGSIPFVPSQFLDHLSPTGRLVAITGERPVMEARLITRTGPSSFDARDLFETVAPALHHFPRLDSFRF